VAWEIEESVSRGKQVVGVYPKDAKLKSYPDAINIYKIKCVPWPDLAKTISRLK
jgi:hypothetical protein